MVFVAGLGAKFNLGDRSGRIIFERDAGLGLRVVDPERMIEYPSAAHVRAAGQVERHARAEELRILYVAMTRAREKLMLVGSTDDLCRKVGIASDGGLSSLQIVSASRPLDWIIPALKVAPPGRVQWPGGPDVDLPLIEVHEHPAEQIVRWRIQAPRRGGRKEARRGSGIGRRSAARGAQD